MSSFRFDRLDLLLKKNKMTRKFLCMSSGHADNYIRMFEKRNTDPPREFVNFCSSKLNTTSAYLFGETDDPSPVISTPVPAEQKENALQSAADRLTEGLNEESIKKLYEYAKLLKLGQESAAAESEPQS